MRQYNVEIFDRDMNYVSNTSCEDASIKEDYLDPEKYSVELYDVNPRINYFIHFQSDELDHIGIIESYEEKANKLTKVSVSELASLFDVDVIEDVSKIGVGTMEEYIKDWIEKLFIDGDTEMRLPLDITISSTTPDWLIEYECINEPDEDEPEPTMRACELTLFDDIILPAFNKYQIVLDYSIDLNRKRIHIDIGKNTAAPMVIESDMTNILDKKVIIRKAAKQTNLVIVYDEEDYTRSVTYYLHPDGSFDKNNRDRVSPVLYSVESTKKETEDETVVKTFEEAALEKASDIFGKNKYTNLIELEMFRDDSLINPDTLKVGQVVKVISNGIIYDSILTAREIKETTKLIFGTIRLELTKILKGRT